MTDIEASSHFTDTHAHLNDDQFAEDYAAVVQRSAATGVRAIVNVAFSRSMWEAAVALSESVAGVSFTAGIHPNSAGEWDPATRAALDRFIADHSPVAIGETGLDYYWNSHPRDVQIEAFRDQLATAIDAGLPVIIHMRGEVEPDIRALLEGKSDLLCVFHSFDGSPQLAKWIVDKGWMIGVGGLMSRRSARVLRETLKSIPIEHLLLETDSPYLAPTGWDHKRNTPESIPVIAAHLARLREEPIETIARATTENAERVFGLRPTVGATANARLSGGREA